MKLNNWCDTKCCALYEEADMETVTYHLKGRVAIEPAHCRAVLVMSVLLAHSRTRACVRICTAYACCCSNPAAEV